MRCIDEQFLATPWYGSRQMTRPLRRQGNEVGRKRVRRLMRQMGLTALYRKPQTSSPDGSHRVYPYRLGHLRIERPNQVWCADVTYIPMQRGFHYLVAIMDWATRTVLSWRLSNTQDSAFCREALQEARWPATENRTSSTPTRAVSLQAGISPRSSSKPG